MDQALSMKHNLLGTTVECVYWTEPKATCRQCKNPPNAYKMYTDLEGILSVCLYLHISFNSGVVQYLFRTTHSPSTGEIQIYRKKTP